MTRDRSPLDTELEPVARKTSSRRRYNSTRRWLKRYWHFYKLRPLRTLEEISADIAYGQQILVTVSRELTAECDSEALDFRAPSESFGALRTLDSKGNAR